MVLERGIPRSGYSPRKGDICGGIRVYRMCVLGSTIVVLSIFFSMLLSPLTFAGFFCGVIEVIFFGIFRLFKVMEPGLQKMNVIKKWWTIFMCRS